MFSSKIHELPNFHGGYPAAVRHFNETKKPRSVKWGEDERPLYKVSMHHYRLVRGPVDQFGDAEYYDAVLYKTPMLRLFKPKEDGTVAKWVRNYDSQTSARFLCRVGNMYSGMRVTTSEGGERWLPLSTSCTSDWFCLTSKVTVPSGWSAVITSDDKGIVLGRSAHRPVYTPVATQEDIDLRKDFKQALAYYADMFVLRMSNCHDRVMAKAPDIRKQQYQKRRYPEYRFGYPYAAHKINPVSFHHALKDFDESVFKILDAIALAVYARALAKLPDEEDQVSTKVFRNSFVTRTMELCQMKRASGKKWYENFPEALPKKVYC